MEKKYIWGKRLIMAAVITSMAGTCCGCTKEQKSYDDNVTEGDSEITIGMSFDSFVIERWIRDRNVFISKAEELGASVNVQSANGDSEQQIAQIRYLIKEDVDVIVVIPVDCTALSEVLQEAADKGIKVISYDRLAEKSNVDLYISFDNERVGRQMAQALKEALPGGGDIIMISGPLTDDNVKQVEAGFYSEIENSGLEVVYSDRCDNWNALLAYDIVNEALEEYPGVDAVMCGNDDVATQVFRALSEKRKAGKIYITGQDGDLMACQRIVQGTQLVTIFKSVEEEATTAAEYAVMLANGEELDIDSTIYDGSNNIPYLELEPVPVDAENIDEIIIDGGFHNKEEVYQTTDE